MTTLYSFCSQSECTDGSGPAAGLVQAADTSDLELYGTTTVGGPNGFVTLFKITPGGTLTTLHTFDSTDGANPEAALVQDTNGNLYGTTTFGGSNHDGTVFSLSVGLGSFVKPLPHSGKVGAAIGILGTDLRSATVVTFNGTPATFTVVSPALITTTVPAGASTGKIQVTTPGGTLFSGGPFVVIP